jgi:hypothetical protein
MVGHLHMLKERVESILVSNLHMKTSFYENGPVNFYSR